MMHGLDTGFLVAAEVTERADYMDAQATLARLIGTGDVLAIAPWGSFCYGIERQSMDMAKNKKATSPSNGSGDVESLFQEMLAGKGDLSPAERLQLREELNWQINYAGQYVAFFQEWNGRGAKGKAVRRV